jgi:dihydroorotase-like cyclic amidohydrolase
MVTPDGTIRGDLYVKDGRVVGLGRLDVSPRETVDAGGLMVLPGMIDAHVHFMDPGDTSREDFPTGSAAAAVAGVTTVIEHSHSSPVYTGAELREKVSYLKSRSVVDFGLGLISLLGCRLIPVWFGRCRLIKFSHAQPGIRR